MAVNEEGKYTKLTPETIKLLEDAFAMDCSIVEACLNANIRTQTYYNWIKDNPELAERFDELRNRPYLLARTTIIKAIKDNPQYAFEYMKRKKKGEFSERQEMTGADGKDLPTPIIKLETNVSRNNSNEEDSEPIKED